MIALLALPVHQTLKAQHLQASLSHLSTENGLPSNAIAAITSDDYGYVWISTWNGVSRFDGFNFYNYKTGITSGIKGLHNRVDYLTTDQAQNVWMKMYDGRLFVINRQTDCIEDPLKGIGGHEEFKIDYFFVPFVSTSGDLYVAFKDVGIYKLRLDRTGLKTQPIMTNQLQANCIAEGYHGDIWVGTDKGVHRVDMPNLALERKGYFLEEHITRITSNGYNIFVATKSGKIMQFSYGQEPTLIKDIGREITSLYVDSRGLIWFSDLGFGAYRLNPETGDIKAFSQQLPVPEFTSRGAEFHEAMGVLWVRMNHGGYGYYNRETDEVEYFHNDPSNPWNLSNTVNASFEMDNGVIWESTVRRGLEKLEIQKNTITRTLLIPSSSSSLDNEVRGMLHDPKRNVTLLANKHGQVFVFDGSGNLQTILTHAEDGTPISRPYGISIDSKGNYWVCDKDKGVFKITPTGSGYHIINLCHNDNDPNSLSSNAAYQAVEDYNGNIWVATYGGGVNILQQKPNGKYVALHSKNVIKHYPLNAHMKVRTIALSRDGMVWAGTTDGILIMQIRNNNVVIEQMQMPEDISKGLMSTDIVTMAADKQGAIWVGTNSGGLSQTIGKDKNGAWLFKSYGIEDGMPSEEIRSMTFDENGNLWFATDHTLASFNVTKQIFTTFSHLDGVDDTMCSEAAAITLSNGKILFGTMNGYYTIDRKKLQNSTGSLLKLRITNFYLNDELQSPRLTDIYDYYVPDSRSVTLPYHGCKFSFSFAALNYQLQHRMNYQYKLEGYDSDWRNADKQCLATYKDVPSGTYRFQVKAFLLESPDAYDMRTIEVTVPPHYLLSTTAVWIYLILLAIILLAALWWYQGRLEKRFRESHANDADSCEVSADGNSADADAASQADSEPEIIEEAILLDDEPTDDYQIIR